MWTLLQWLQKNLVWSIPGAMALGLLLGPWLPEPALRALILPLTFLMVYPMMVGVDLRELLRPGGLRLQGVTLAVNFVLLPAIGYALGMLFFPEQPMLRLALLLTALLPTSGMTISWTGMAKGNVPAAVRMTVIGLLAGSLLAPLYLRALLGAVVPVPLLQVFAQIALIVLLPLALGTATRRWLVARHGEAAFKQRLAPRFGPLSTLGVLGIVAVSLALKSNDILAHPAQLPALLVPLLVLYGVNFALSTALARGLFARGDGIALVYGTVMRNLSIALAIAMGVFGAAGAEAALLIALAYVVQVQAAAWYVRLTPRLFGPAPEAGVQRVA